MTATFVILQFRLFWISDWPNVGESRKFPEANIGRRSGFHLPLSAAKIR
jgi:hypothetical protein